MLESVETDWLICICSVIFDIDEGQKILEIYPPGAVAPAEASDVAFHAFPVCSPLSTGDSCCACSLNVWH